MFVFETFPVLVKFGRLSDGGFCIVHVDPPQSSVGYILMTVRLGVETVSTSFFTESIFLRSTRCHTYLDVSLGSRCHPLSLDLKKSGIFSPRITQGNPLIFIIKRFT